MITPEEALQIRKNPEFHKLDNPNFWHELSECIDEALNFRCTKPPIRYESCPEDIFLCPACGSTFVKHYGVLMGACNNCGQLLKEVEE